MRKNIASSAAWLLLVALASPTFAATIFEETFETYAEGSNLGGQGGWIDGPLTVATGLLGSKVANGLVFAGTGTQSRTIRPLPTLDTSRLYSLSFDAFAMSSSPRSHNSGVFFSDASSALIAGWYTENNPNTGKPLQSWAFRTLSGNVLFSGGFDKPVRLEIVLDPINGEVFGRADFGSGVFETSHSQLPTGVFASIDRILIDQDFRFSPGFLGVEVDNIALATSTSGLPSTSEVFPAKGGNAGAVSVRISAPGIKMGATAKLTGIGPDIPGSNFASPSPRVVTATFDLTGVPPGVRDVVVINPDSSVITLQAAFTVEIGGAPNVRIRKGGTTAVPGRVLDYFIIIENTGNVDAPYQAPQEYLDRYKHIADPNRRAYVAMITAMDDQIGRVLGALERRKMRDNTLVVFQSDNGGPRSAKFTGEVDTSKGTIPADNGPYREGKGMLYEGGTRVVALANWPGRIRPGSVVDQPIHVVDMYPTLATLAGAPLGKNKPLDGMDVWPTLGDGRPSPRDEVVYDIEPFRAAVRKGDWKLVWRTTLPSKVELFNLAQDPAEKINLADENPQKVTDLQQRAEALAREAVQPLLLSEALGIVWKVATASVALPADAWALDLEP
jgi:hypothetical protein